MKKHESKLAMANAYAHLGLTDMALKSQPWELVFIREQKNHPDLGLCWIGSFVCGIGAFDVHFPIENVRLIDDQEKTKLLGTTFGASFRSPFRFSSSDIADEQWMREHSLAAVQS